jgi:hypothetical protein
MGRHYQDIEEDEELEEMIGMEPDEEDEEEIGSDDSLLEVTGENIEKILSGDDGDYDFELIPEHDDDDDDYSAHEGDDLAEIVEEDNTSDNEIPVHVSPTVLGKRSRNKFADDKPKPDIKKPEIKEKTTKAKPEKPKEKKKKEIEPKLKPKKKETKPAAIAKRTGASQDVLVQFRNHVKRAQKNSVKSVTDLFDETDFSSMLTRLVKRKHPLRQTSIKSYTNGKIKAH